MFKSIEENMETRIQKILKLNLENNTKYIKPRKPILLNYWLTKHLFQANVTLDFVIQLKTTKYKTTVLQMNTKINRKDK